VIAGSPHIQTRFHVPRPTRHHHISPFVYRTITVYGRTSQSVPLELIWLNGLFPFRSPLLRESQLISFPKGTEMFHFPSFALQHYVFMLQYLPYGKWVSPFRHLRITGYLPPPRSFSQAITSFFASDCQGIHHMHLITWLYNPKQSFILTSRISNRLWWFLITFIQLAFVHLSTVQLQLDSYTKTLDSVNFARTHFL
jgi:hypothetical protein